MQGNKVRRSSRSKSISTQTRLQRSVASTATRSSKRRNVTPLSLDDTLSRKLSPTTIPTTPSPQTLDPEPATKGAVKARPKTPFPDQEGPVGSVKGGNMKKTLEAMKLKQQQIDQEQTTGVQIPSTDSPNAPGRGVLPIKPLYDAFLGKSNEMSLKHSFNPDLSKAQLYESSTRRFKKINALDFTADPNSATGQQLLNRNWGIQNVLSFLRTQKVSNMVVFDTSGQSVTCDYTVVCNVASAKPMQALTSKLVALGRMNKAVGYDKFSAGDDPDGLWNIASLSHIVVHILTPAGRMAPMFQRVERRLLVDATLVQVGEWDSLVDPWVRQDQELYDAQVNNKALDWDAKVDSLNAAKQQSLYGQPPPPGYYIRANTKAIAPTYNHTEEEDDYNYLDLNEQHMNKLELMKDLGYQDDEVQLDPEILGKAMMGTVDLLPVDGKQGHDKTNLHTPGARKRQGGKVSEFYQNDDNQENDQNSHGNDHVVIENGSEDGDDIDGAMEFLQDLENGADGDDDVDDVDEDVPMHLQKFNPSSTNTNNATLVKANEPEIAKTKTNRAKKATKQEKNVEKSSELELDTTPITTTKATKTKSTPKSTKATDTDVNKGEGDAVKVTKGTTKKVKEVAAVDDVKAATVDVEVKTPLKKRGKKAVPEIVVEDVPEPTKKVTRVTKKVTRVTKASKAAIADEVVEEVVKKSTKKAAKGVVLEAVLKKVPKNLISEEKEEEKVKKVKVTVTKKSPTSSPSEVKENVTGNVKKAPKGGKSGQKDPLNAAASARPTARSKMTTGTNSPSVQTTSRAQFSSVIFGAQYLPTDGEDVNSVENNSQNNFNHTTKLHKSQKKIQPFSTFHKSSHHKSSLITTQRRTFVTEGDYTDLSRRFSSTNHRQLGSGNASGSDLDNLTIGAFTSFDLSGREESDFTFSTPLSPSQSSRPATRINYNNVPASLNNGNRYYAMGTPSGGVKSGKKISGKNETGFGNLDDPNPVLGFDLMLLGADPVPMAHNALSLHHPGQRQGRMDFDGYEGKSDHEADLGMIGFGMGTNTGPKSPLPTPHNRLRSPHQNEHELSSGHNNGTGSGTEWFDDLGDITNENHDYSKFGFQDSPFESLEHYHISTPINSNSTQVINNIISLQNQQQQQRMEQMGDEIEGGKLPGVITNIASTTNSATHHLLGEIDDDFFTRDLGRGFGTGGIMFGGIGMGNNINFNHLNSLTNSHSHSHASTLRSQHHSIFDEDLDGFEVDINMMGRQMMGVNRDFRGENHFHNNNHHHHHDDHEDDDDDDDDDNNHDHDLSHPSENLDEFDFDHNLGDALAEHRNDSSPGLEIDADEDVELQQYSRLLTSQRHRALHHHQLVKNQLRHSTGWTDVDDYDEGDDDDEEEEEEEVDVSKTGGPSM